LTDFLATLDLRTDPRRGVEPGDAGSAGAHALDERSLRHELELDLAAADHLLGRRQAVGKAAEGCHQFRDLSVLEENLGGRRSEAGRVRDQRELACATTAKRLDGARRPAREHPKAADQDGGAVFDPVDGARWGFDDLVHDSAYRIIRRPAALPDGLWRKRG